MKSNSAAHQKKINLLTTQLNAVDVDDDDDDGTDYQLSLSQDEIMDFLRGAEK